MPHDYPLPHTSWQEGEIINVGNPIDFWQTPIKLLRQQFEALESIDLGSCDHQTWYYSIMGHGSTPHRKANRRRVFRGQTSLAQQAACGPIRCFDGRSASISWRMTIIQVSVCGNQICAMVREVSCRLTATAHPIRTAGQLAGHRLSYRLKTKSRQQPTTRLYATKSEWSNLALQLPY